MGYDGGIYYNWLLLWTNIVPHIRQNHTDYFHKVYFMHIFASIMYQTSIYWSGFFTHMHRCKTHTSDTLQKNAFFFQKMTQVWTSHTLFDDRMSNACVIPPSQVTMTVSQSMRFCLVLCVQQWPNTTQGAQIMSGLLSLPQRKFTMV